MATKTPKDFIIKEEDITIDLLCRFLTKVDVIGPNECWNWTGHSSKKGYGKFRFKGEIVQAYRFSYALYKGPITNECIRHLCNNPLCCNPNHLEDGTNSENMIDMVAIGRRKTQKLSIKDVIEIKKMLKLEISSKTIEQMFLVCQQTVSDIKCNRRWSHIKI